MYLVHVVSILTTRCVFVCVCGGGGRLVTWLGYQDQMLWKEVDIFVCVCGGGGTGYGIKTRSYEKKLTYAGLYVICLYIHYMHLQCNVFMHLYTPIEGRGFWLPVLNRLKSITFEDWYIVFIFCIHSMLQPQWAYKYIPLSLY